jgi:hypothetical protein
MSLWYIYELIDPRDSTVFYVGKGKKNRIDAHEAEAKRGKQSRKCDRIREIEAAGLSIEKRKVAFFTDEDEAYLAEWKLIQSHENLTNEFLHCQRAAERAAWVSDEVWVRSAAQLARMTQYGKLTVLVNGCDLKLGEILAHYVQKASQVIAVRGVNWANRIAGKYGVRFADGNAS